MRLKSGKVASVTISGTIIPAGGNFEEPVTQATPRWWARSTYLSRERSDARKVPPAIHPSTPGASIRAWWTKSGEQARAILKRSNEINRMMKVIGERAPPTRTIPSIRKGGGAGRGVSPVELLRPHRRRLRPRPPALRVRRTVRCAEARFRNSTTRKRSAPFFNQLRQSSWTGTIPSSGRRSSRRRKNGSRTLSEQGSALRGES